VTDTNKHTTIYKKTSQINYFEGFDDEVLIEMAMYYPHQFKMMCILISLDLQAEKESYDKNISNRRDLC